MLILDVLNDDVLNIIIKESNIKCHVCNKSFDFKKNFYKKQSCFYFCSKLCYEFN